MQDALCFFALPSFRRCEGVAADGLFTSEAPLGVWVSPPLVFSPTTLMQDALISYPNDQVQVVRKIAIF